MRAIQVEAYGSPSDVVKEVDVPDLEPMIAWRLETTKRRQCLALYSQITSGCMTERSVHSELQ
jgi:hypothetical protein